MPQTLSTHASTNRHARAPVTLRHGELLRHNSLHAVAGFREARVGPFAPRGRGRRRHPRSARRVALHGGFSRGRVLERSRSSRMAPCIAEARHHPSRLDDARHRWLAISRRAKRRPRAREHPGACSQRRFHRESSGDRRRGLSEEARRLRHADRDHRSPPRRERASRDPGAPRADRSTHVARNARRRRRPRDQQPTRIRSPQPRIRLRRAAQAPLAAIGTRFRTFRRRFSPGRRRGGVADSRAVPLACKGGAPRPGSRSRRRGAHPKYRPQPADVLPPRERSARPAADRAAPRRDSPHGGQRDSPPRAARQGIRPGPRRGGERGASRASLPEPAAQRGAGSPRGPRRDQRDPALAPVAGPRSRGRGSARQRGGDSRRK